MRGQQGRIHLTKHIGHRGVSCQPWVALFLSWQLSLMCSGQRWIHLQTVLAEGWKWKSCMKTRHKGEHTEAWTRICRERWIQCMVLRTFLPIPLSLAKICTENGSNVKGQLQTAQIDGEKCIPPSFQCQTTVVPPHCCQKVFPLPLRNLSSLRLLL